jgi:mannan endo-1,4-beta-mannosidase
MKYLIYILVMITFFSCKKKQTTEPITTNPPLYSLQYSTIGKKLYNFATPKQCIGADALHVYAAGSSDMKTWNMDIAREFVGNMKEQPINGYPVHATNGDWLHSLQEVVDSNRANNLITIICPFRWDGQTNTDFTGVSPGQAVWYTDYKIKMQEWATWFKSQPDVWLEVWNEPYRYDRADGYTDDVWYNDMNDMVSTIRGTGNTNIVLVPCCEQGQDESVLTNKGISFLADKYNILFDVHAYEKWLQVSNTNMGNRLQQLQQNNLPVLFGEVAPLNTSGLMNPQPFLDSVYNRGMSVAAWAWKYDGTDTDALLNAQGLPNDNSNNNWGSTYKTLCLKVRKP